MTAGPGGHLALMAALVGMGAGWGLTQPLSKIAVTGLGHPLGLVVWQLAIGAVLLSAVNVARGRRLPLHRRALALYAFIAVAGTILPNSASYAAAAHLPAGIMSIVISAVPMFAFPIALALGSDRFSARRALGLGLGIAGVALIALPEASLPERALVAFLPLALLAPLCYAIEGNVVDILGTGGMDGMTVMQGASTVGVLIGLPLSLATGQFILPVAPWGAPEASLIIASCIHAVVYSLYVTMVGRAGAVFATQVSYLVTGFGVVWAMILLGERYPLTVWLALGVMAAGLGLVQPRRRVAVSPAGAV